MSELIFGKNAVLEAFKAGLPVKKVIVSRTLKDINRFTDAIIQLSPGIKIEVTQRKSLDLMAKDSRSGGVCAELPVLKPYSQLDKFVSAIRRKTEHPLLVALDEIQDPHNFGAIVRTALGAGFSGVLFQKRRQVGITGVVVSTSAGACFKIPLCEVVNLPRALENLKRSGFWVYGTDSKQSNSLYNSTLNRPIVIVIGSEGKGLRKLVRSKCDEIISIPLSTELESLNASVAAGIVLFEVVRQGMKEYSEGSK